MEMVLSCRNHPDVVEGLRYCSRCGQAFCPDCLVAIRGNTYCATCKAEQVRDLTSGVDRSTLELAGIGRRFGALYIAYEALMLGARGQTLGKMAMKIKVVRPDGTAISKGQAWGRSFMRQILASCLSIFNYLPAFFTKERTCLHDLVANTRVVNWS